MLRPLHHAGRHLASHRTASARARRYISSSGATFTVAQLLESDTVSQDAPSDKSVTLNGFVRTVRKQKRVAFAAIGDGTSLDAVQAVLTPEQAGELSTGAALRITGKWQPSPSGKEQSHELVATKVQALGENDAEVLHWRICRVGRADFWAEISHPEEISFKRLSPYAATSSPSDSVECTCAQAEIRSNSTCH